MTSTSTVKISRQSLQEAGAPAATITQVKPLASYTWIEAPVPTIAVPGIPAQWSPPRVASQLPKDTGLVYIAQNAARHPDSPLEPLFRAVYIAQPDFDMSGIDVISDRNNIRKLLSFINPSTSKNGLEPFTINVEVTNNTAIFSRTETKTTEFISPREFRGYGHEFEKAYTNCDISDSAGHHRIVSYRFAGLNIIVRHEVDGYIKPAGETSLSSKRPANDDISSLLGSMSLSGSKGGSRKITTNAGSKLNICKEGHSVPIDSTLEIKTRVAHKPLPISEIAAQLWVSQTPKLVRAFHQRGVFQKPQVEDVSAEVRRWEQSNQASLKKLVTLIQKIIAATKGQGGFSVVRYDTLTDQLTVSKGDGKRVLPEDLYRQMEEKTKAKTVKT
ncbi:hypothetical protein M426DRAFT_319205 [Hypoxylon sp. CI-4A]|nr:hypothetical protein M426DRAFT_319205 [Hypoxylon sp. CI-4A]